MNARSIIADAVAQALFEHDARCPWKHCSCGWLNPSRHLDHRAIKAAFWRHVADAVAEKVIEKMHHAVPN
jgi:hypothetical protein